MINYCSCAHANYEAKLKTSSLFDDNESNLMERNQVSKIITILSSGYQTIVQLTVFKVLFSLGS